MELRLEIKLASVEELSTIAKALAGLQVGEVKPTVEPLREPYAKRAAALSAAVEELTEPESDEMIEVESPYTAHPSETKEAPAPAAKPKPASNKATAAEAKLAKKAQEEAERAERVAKLKANMEAQKDIGAQALTQRAENVQNTTQPEPVESIVEEIKQLGDALMSFTGVDLDGKKGLTAQVMAKVGVPAGVRPTQLQQPMLGQFRDAYKAMVNSVVNPVMGGLV
jgi:hypothetical protein